MAMFGIALLIVGAIALGYWLGRRAGYQRGLYAAGCLFFKKHSAANLPDAKTFKQSSGQSTLGNREPHEDGPSCMMSRTDSFA